MESNLPCNTDVSMWWISHWSSTSLCTIYGLILGNFAAFTDENSHCQVGPNLAKTSVSRQLPTGNSLQLAPPLSVHHELYKCSRAFFSRISYVLPIVMYHAYNSKMAPTETPSPKF